MNTSFFESQPREIIEKIFLDLNSEDFYAFCFVTKGIQKKFSLDPEIWKKIAIKERFPFPNKFNFSLLRNRMLQKTNAKKIWEKFMYYENKYFISSFFPGASKKELNDMERRLGFLIPDQLYASLCIYNGQDLSYPPNLFLDGGKLLTATGIAEKRETSIPSSDLIFSTDLGMRYWCIDLNDSGVYLVSGWNRFLKGKDFFDFLARCHD